MSVRTLGDLVATKLHERLKPTGFRKTAKRFSRDRDGFIEVYSINGSQWNSGEQPWRFYLDVGLRIDDIPIRDDVRGIWKHVHALGRIGGVIPGAPPHFEVRADTVEEIAILLCGLIEKASSKLPRFVDAVRKNAEQGHSSHLPPGG